MEKIVFSCAILALVAACGGTTTSSNGGVVTQPPTSGGQTPSNPAPSPPATGGGTLGNGGSPTGGGGGSPTPTGPTNPNYASLGFVATEDNTLNVTSVIVIDNDGVTDSFRAASATDLSIIYDPANRDISIYSEGRAFDGSIDGESRSFFDSGTGFGAGSPNFVRVNTGGWSYVVDGNIDQNDGPYRHNIAAAGGERFNHGFGGTATYDGNALGTLEIFRSTNSQSIPFVAEGSITVDFSGAFSGSQAVFGSYALDPNRSNGATGLIAIADGIFVPGAGLDGTTQFRQGVNAGITVDGEFIYAEGSLSGLVAGPNAEEVSGTFNMSNDGFDYNSSLTGVFFGTR